MAFRILLKELNNTKKVQLKKMLTVRAEPNLFKMKKFKGSSKEVEFMKFSDKGYIDIPFKMGSGLFKVAPNMNNRHRKAKGRFINELYDYQEPIVERCMEFINDNQTCILQAYTGFGKTIVSTFLHCNFPNKTLGLVMVALGDHAKQWKKAYENNTTMRVKVLENTRKMSVSDFNHIDVIICLYTRVENIPTKILDRIGELFIDEGHLFCTQNKVSPLLSVHPKRIIVYTATLEREDDGMEKMIYMLTGKENMVMCDIIKDFTVYKVNTGLEVPDIRAKAGHRDYVARMTWISEDDRLNKMIVMHIYKLCQNTDNKILVTCCRVEHAQGLEEQFQEYCKERRHEIRAKRRRFRKAGKEYRTEEKYRISSDWLAGNKKNHFDSRVIFGNTQKMGTGYDIANFCDDFDGINFNVWICLCSFKKKSVLYQNAGRVIFRTEDPIVYHYVHNDVIIKRHWGISQGWYKSKGATVKEKNLENLTWEDIDNYEFEEHY